MRIFLKTILLALLATFCLASCSERFHHHDNELSYILQHSNYEWFFPFKGNSANIRLDHGKTHLQVHDIHANLIAFTNRPEYLYKKMASDIILKNWKLLLRNDAQAQTYIKIYYTSGSDGTQASSNYDVRLTDPVKTSENTWDFTVLPDSTPVIWPSEEIGPIQLMVVFRLL